VREPSRHPVVGGKAFATRRESGSRLRTFLFVASPAALIAIFMFALQPAQGAETVWSGLAISGPPTPDPYAPPPAIFDTAAGPDVETTIVADESSVDIGNGKIMNAETYRSCSSVTVCSGNGLIPGPTFRLDVGDTLTVRLVNRLSQPTAIHWHGAELANRSDGTPFTQQEVCAGCTLMYKFKAFRPGIFWYHPHHHASTNQTFRGLYGMIIVKDPNEATLISSGSLPPAANTLPVVLSDVTVCKAVGSNDAATYDLTLPWVGGPTPAAQPGPTPKNLCEDSPIDDSGDPRAAYAAGDVPSIQTKASAGRTNEGQTVLTNGVNVGGRAGSPSAPGALASGAYIKDVAAGQGLRLQLLNAAAIRYLRLRLTTAAGGQVPLVRIGGEAGLLDNAVIEGGVISGFDTGFGSGEILLPPGSRADVIAAIPASAPAGSVLTLWTQDFQRTGSGAGWTNTPTVPVMHLRIAGSVPQYTISAGTPLRSSIAGQAVEALGPATGTLLNPASFGKVGSSAQDIRLTAGGASLGIDTVRGRHEVPDYAVAAHLASTRYAKPGDTLQLTVTNATGAHHPYHPHGFSIQPISLTKTGSPTYTWPYREFRDNVDVRAGYTLTYRVRIDPRPLADGSTPGGELGRWLFHCHIFFHAVNGMIGELVVANASGNEKPTIDMGGTWVYVSQGNVVTRHGRWRDPDGDTVSLAASLGTVTKNANGTWDWQYTPPVGAMDDTTPVYITATDSNGNKDQIPFRLRIGGLDDGADNGDPHLTTTNAKFYDFQAVGEFTLLRDFDGLEIQARQTPVGTAAPITDPYSGLTSCVSVNTAVGAQLGDHRIAIQPAPGPPAKSGERLLVFVDGRAADVGQRGLNLAPGARLVSYPLAGGAAAYEIDYPDSTVLMVTPWFWDAHQVWLLNVSVSRTPAYLGVMGDIPQSSWLPVLPTGATLGPKPTTLSARYSILYSKFANAWRVSNQTSLFMYSPGTSTATFSDPKWPPKSGPCKVNRKFGSALAKPAGPTINTLKAERYCSLVTVKKLHADCVFDVSATGDPKVAGSYLQSQELTLRATTTRVDVGADLAPADSEVTLVATVASLGTGRRAPTGTAVFLVDGRLATKRLPLNKRGQARARLRFEPGVHEVMASYAPDRDQKPLSFLPSTSPIAVQTTLTPARANAQCPLSPPPSSQSTLLCPIPTSNNKVLRSP
jgi:FtsP/CotA-like multicopper oxidase with cupredoxin domain